MPWKPSEPGEFPTLGWYAVDWIEGNLARPDRQDYEPLLLTREQAEFLLDFYRLDPETCRRAVRRGVLSRARGWGKSPIMGAICMLEGLGDVVPDGWDADGQPVGRPWATERRVTVTVAAVTEQQTRNAWLPLLEMAQGPVLDAYPGLEPMEGFVNLPGPRGSRIAPITASPKSIKGEPTVFAVLDQALALDTPVPVPGGWSTMGQLRSGDEVFGSSGTPVRVIEAKPVSVEHDCYRVTFLDGTSVVASAGHLWWTKLHSAAAPQVRTTQQMLRDGRTFRVPVAPARQDRPADQPVPGYLLGLWLGDGTRGKCELAVSEDDLKATQAALAVDGVSSWPRRYEAASRGYGGGRPAVSLTFTRGAGYQASDRPEAARRFRELPCFVDKHVPAEYLQGTSAQRTAVLQGLMDADGHCTELGLCTFVNTNRRIVDALVQLLRSLGQTTSGARWIADERYTGGGKWRVDFTPRAGLTPFRLPRKASRVRGTRRAPWMTVRSITPVERVPVRCIAVDAPDHLFAAGEAGHLTHNTEMWTPSNGGVKLATIMLDNAAKAGGTVIETPNAYTPGEGSVAENTADAQRAMAEGRAKRDGGILYDHREAPPDTDMSDEASLVAGLRYAYGDSSAHPDGCTIHDPPCPPGWADISDRVSRVWDPDADPQDAAGNFLNQITHAADAWLSSPEWAARNGADHGVRPVADRDVVVLGFDGSRGRVRGKPDATALVGVRVADGHVFQLGVWEAGDRPLEWPKWAPPIPAIETEIAEAFRRFQVAGFYCDPGRDWRSHVNAWEARWGSRVQVRGTRDHPFEWWMTGGRTGLVQRAVEQLEGAVRNGDMTHDGSARLTAHVLGARRRVRAGKLSLAKESDYSVHKIDAAVAAVLAWQARLDALAAGVTQRPTSTKLERLY